MVPINGISTKWHHLRYRTKILVIFGGAAIVAIVLAAVVGIAAETDDDFSTKDNTGVGRVVISANDWVADQVGATGIREGQRQEADRRGRETRRYLQAAACIKLAEGVTRPVYPNLGDIYEALEGLELAGDSEIGQLARDARARQSTIFTEAATRQNYRALRSWCAERIPDDPALRRWYSTG